MKLVVLDGYTENPGDLSWKGLEVLGELTVYDRTSYTESPLIAQRIGDAEIVIMNKTPISRATIDACPNIRLIAVLATGYNVVDYQHAREKGIPVVNVPTYGTASVSQFSIALINKETIAKMKGGAILLNNARGQLIVEQDVADALNSGKLAAAGLDVVYTEPIRPDNPLLTAKNCILTPHISWAPKESRQRIMEITAENIRAFLNGTPQNVVNP